MLVDGDHPASLAPTIDALDLADIGDFRIAHGDIPGTLAKIEEQAAPLEHLVALGGDHTITLALLRALARAQGPAGARAFRRDTSTPGRRASACVWGHGSPFYHAIEEGLDRSATHDPGRDSVIRSADGHRCTIGPSARA